MVKQVLRGRTYRVQIRVSDHSDDFDRSEWTQRFCAERLSRGESLFFISVYALHGMYDKYTSYSIAGKQLYHGNELEEAIKRIIPFMAGDVQLSKAFTRYTQQNWDLWLKHVHAVIDADPTLRKIKLGQVPHWYRPKDD